MNNRVGQAGPGKPALGNLTQFRTDSYGETAEPNRCAPFLELLYTPSDFSLRWSAERSMPMNSAVFEMLPPKRLIWAIR